MDIHGVSILARGITASGPEGTVFENVDVSVQPGSLAVVAGARGAGRTSMLLALSGRLRLVAGYLDVSGYVVPRQAKIVRQLIVPARLRPGFELEGLQRVREATAERQVIAGVSTSAIDYAFGLVGVDPDPHALIDDLHPGEQLLLSVALTVAGAPAGILIDDVDAGLPLTARAQVWEALKAVTSTGMTVLVSSTDPLFGGGATVIPLPSTDYEWEEPDPGEPTEVIPLLNELEWAADGSGRWRGEDVR